MWIFSDSQWASKKCQYLFIMFPSVLMEQSIISGPVPSEYCFVFIGGVGSGYCVCVCVHAYTQSAQLHPTLCYPVACSPPAPGSSVHGLLQARILEWIAIFFSRGSSQPRNWTQVSRIAGRFFTSWTTGEAPLPLSHLGNAILPKSYSANPFKLHPQFSEPWA